MLAYWQELKKKVENMWAKVQDIEILNHDIYNKLDDIQVGWKVAEDIKIKMLVPKKMIPLTNSVGQISIINNDEILFYRLSGEVYKLYKYTISTETETEIGELPTSGVGRMYTVWRKDTNYYAFGSSKIDIYNSSFVYQSTVVCDMYPLYGAWINTNKFFLKGKDGTQYRVGVPCMNGIIEEWTTTKQSETKYSNYLTFWKRDDYDLIHSQFLSTEGLFLCGQNIYFLIPDLFDLFRKKTPTYSEYYNEKYQYTQYRDFYIGDDILIAGYPLIGSPYGGGVIYVC